MCYARGPGKGAKVTKKRKTAFDRDFERDMRRPEFRAAYKRARARIDAIDAIVHDIDNARERQNLTKAELARRMGVKPEAVRRLLTTSEPNPTVGTLVAAADAVGLRIQAVSRGRKKLAASK